MVGMLGQMKVVDERERGIEEIGGRDLFLEGYLKRVMRAIVG